MTEPALIRHASAFSRVHKPQCAVTVRYQRFTVTYVATRLDCPWLRTACMCFCQIWAQKSSTDSSTTLFYVGVLGKYKFGQHSCAECVPGQFSCMCMRQCMLHTRYRECDYSYFEDGRAVTSHTLLLPSSITSSWIWWIGLFCSGELRWTLHFSSEGRSEHRSADCDCEGTDNWAVQQFNKPSVVSRPGESDTWHWPGWM